MPSFLAVFTGTPQAMERSGWNALSSDERQRRTEAGMRAWQDWMATHRDQVTTAGGPLGKTLRIARDGITDSKNSLCGYIVVTAASHQAAASLFVDHPHFSIFPGEAVEVLECLPTPGG